MENKQAVIGMFVNDIGRVGVVYIESWEGSFVREPVLRMGFHKFFAKKL